MRRDVNGSRPAAAAILLLSLLAGSLSAQPIIRASQSSAGEAPNPANSARASISADGRHVAFRSLAFNLVPNDSNSNWDIFVHDRLTRTTVLVSVSSTGEQANAESDNPVLSADGRYVAFDSYASNLIANDWNNFRDIFLHDRDPDGNGVFDEGNGVTTRVTRSGGFTETNSNSWQPSLSADARFVGFVSVANNIVANDTEGQVDAFIHDRQLDTMERISVAPDGSGGNSRTYWLDLSDDGQVAVFSSAANNLVPDDQNAFQDAFVYERATGQLTLVSRNHQGGAGGRIEDRVGVSGDGQQVGFSTSWALQPDDTNGKEDVFVFDRTQQSLLRVSVTDAGGESSRISQFGSINTDGRFVTFRSDYFFDELDANGWFDLYLHDRDADGNGVLDEPGGIDTQLISLSPEGEVGTFPSWDSSVSGDGRQVGFTSVANNFVPDDDFQSYDIFIRDTIRLYLEGTPAPGHSVRFAIHNAHGESGNLALVVLSCAGKGPFDLPADGGPLYLTPDTCTSLGLSAGVLFQGLIDPNGRATTPFVIFPGISPGLTIHAAAVTIQGGAFVSTTSPVTLLSQ